MATKTPLIGQINSSIRQNMLDSGHTIPRRRFLHWGSGLALGLATKAFASNSPKIAILGAGVSGLTAAYLLGKKQLDVHVFEASARLGGRIYSAADFNDEHMFVELGGEFIDSGHQQIRSLCQELGLELDDLEKDEKGQELYYFADKVHGPDDFQKQFAKIADAIAKDAQSLYDEQGQFTLAAKKFDQINLKSYLQRFAGQTEAWVLRLLDLAYVVEYGLETRQQSSLNFIDLIASAGASSSLYGESDERYRIRNGNQQLCYALADRVQQRRPIAIQHRLQSLDFDPGERKFKLSFTLPGQKNKVEEGFDYVICSLPFSVLRGIDGIDKLPISSEKKTVIHKLGYGQNTKIMLPFAERFWRKESPEFLWRSNGSIYADGGDQCYWETSRAQKGRRGILTNYLGGEAATQTTAKPWGQRLESLQNLFKQDLRQMGFAGQGKTWPWVNYPFSKASYSAPFVGQYTSYIQIAAQNELDDRMIFIGEHCSEEFFGFMNGAVESGMQAAALF